MSRTTARRPALMLATAGLGAVAIAAAAVAIALPSTATGRLAAPIPVVTSENVSLLTTVPETQAISMEFARTGEFAYISSLDTISVLDISDPKAPKITGTVVNAMFQNEAMTYGERVGADGKLTRFVLAGIDLYQADASGKRKLGGNEFLIVDVTDPVKPFIRSRVRTSTSTHTVQCVSQENCTTAYSAGTSGKFSVLDLSDLDAPKEVGVVPSPASGGGGPHTAFSGNNGAGHYWDFGGGVGWHTGSGGATAFDISDPLNPVPINGTGPQGRQPVFNDFILHSSQRPNAEAFLPNSEPSIWNGNVLLAGEEDYLNEGDEVECSKAGSFQTWYVPDLDGAAYQERGGDVDAGNITNLDLTNAPAEFGGGLTTPASAFCSMHWFDVNQNGFVAQGWYGAGMRILDVRDPRNITQVGYATTAVTEVWDAYWVPERDENGVVTGDKTNILYSADLTRGIDVYEVTLPELTDEQKAQKAAMEQRLAAAGGSSDTDTAATTAPGSQGRAVAAQAKGKRP